MTNSTSRRGFIKASAAAAATVGLHRFTARSYANVIGSNTDIRMGVIGFNGRGMAHIDGWLKIPGVRLVSLCDADARVLEKGRKHVVDAQAASKQPAAELAVSQDLRHMLDSKEVDAISTATPNFWHSLIVVLGCQAGKDVYVEKPVSHNVWEGRQAVKAARKYNRIVQAGTQYRSSAPIHEAVDYIHAGKLGKVKVGRALVYNRRGSIGKVESTPELAKEIDLNMWCGPTPLEAPHRKNFHYDWHWVFSTGNGELGNNGIHMIDLVRWAMNKNELSRGVISVGGRFAFNDDGNTPNTQFAVHNYDDSLMIMEVRGLPTKPNSPKVDTYKKQSIGWIVECENGYVAGGTSAPAAYDHDDKLIQKFDGANDKKLFGQNHFQNFIDGVRSRKIEGLHAEIEQGHLSSALCHTPNISYRLGQQSDPEAVAAAMKSDPVAADTFERFQAHLAVNEVDLKKDRVTLGVPLKMDPKTERFVDNDKANQLLKDVYRAPFVMPEEV